MNPRERILRVLHGQSADRIPFVPYDNLVPRGDFERKLRNGGMGLLVRVHSIWEETPHVSVETKNEGDILVRTYHTPKGDLTERLKTHVGRLKGDDLDMDVEGLIKGVEDYVAAIFILDDTIFHRDETIIPDATRDIGTDGIVRDHGIWAPYGATRYLYGGMSGYTNWVQDQHDHPGEFEELVQAVIRREERRLEMIESGSTEFVGLGDLDGSWGPTAIRRFDIPVYKKWVPRLKAKGKITFLHAHATNLSHFKDLIPDYGVDVIEAFTPPPIGDLSLADARAAWGKDTIIWVNFPETVFLSGAEATKRYTMDLIQSDSSRNALVFGFTEMGVWGAMNDDADRIFRDGTAAILDAIEECGHFPTKV